MQRRAFTLVELLVVMVIILTIFGLTTALLPGTFQDRTVQRGAEMVQRALVMARERAGRDKVPVGVRLIKSADPTNKTAEKLQFIMRPPDITSWAASVQRGSDPKSFTQVTIQGKVSNVNGGDYIEFNGNGLPHRIKGMGPVSNTFEIESGLPYPINQTQQFRIVRQAQPMAGELEMQLPRNIVIDLNYCASTQGYPDNTGNFDPDPATNGVDIIFSPSGVVADCKLAQVDKIILYVRDVSRDANDPSSLLVTIRKRTGFVATYPIDVTAASGRQYGKYWLTGDPRSSGF